MRGIFLLSLACLAIYSTANHAAINQEGLREDRYRGQQHWANQTEGSFCQGYQDISVDYDITLADVVLDVSDEGNLEFDFDFENNLIGLEYRRKGGVLCTEISAGTDILVQKLEAQITLIPAKNEFVNPIFRLRNIAFDELRFKNTHVGAAGYEIAGDLPDWANKWVEDNLNKLIARFLKTELSEHLTDFLTDEIIERLKDKKDDSGSFPGLVAY